jgi:predicted nucleic acid-binding protein
VEADFLRSIVNRTVTIIDLQLADYTRMADLVQTYADFPLGATDASVIAVAEKLGATEIATLDHRHFRAVRPRHIASLTLLP